MLTAIIPVPIAVIANGTGPSALVTAGVHGDEYEGLVIARKLVAELLPEAISGRIVIMPGVNWPAVRARRRVSPIDQKNMNRVFPGDGTSGPTAMIADFIERRLLPGMAYAVDLHSGGTQSVFDPCGYVYGTGERAFRDRKLAAAHAFGAPRTAVVATTSSGGSLSAACERHGVVMVAAELGGGAALDHAGLGVGWEGTLNLLRHAGVLSGDAESDAHGAAANANPRPPTSWPPSTACSSIRSTSVPALTAGDLAGQIWPIDDLARPACRNSVRRRRHRARAADDAHGRSRRLCLSRRRADERRRFPEGNLVAEIAADKPSPIIEMRGVNKWFDKFHVLKDIDLSVRKGERVVVCGPSGSGKSTLIRCINRLEQHDEGTIVVDGIELDEDTKNVAAIRREVGMVFQQFNLFPHLSALENCALPQIRARGTPRAASRSEGHGIPEARPHSRAGAQIPGAAVRRTTAAGGHRAVALHGAEDHALRRADVGARSGNDQGSA